MMRILNEKKEIAPKRRGRPPRVKQPEANPEAENALSVVAEQNAAPAAALEGSLSSS